MLATTRSFRQFKKAIADSTSHLKSDHFTDHLSGGQLCLQSRISNGQNACFLGLQSEKSKIQFKQVKSSIDSGQKPKSTNTSVPLSQLIMRDTGHDHLFREKCTLKRMEQQQRQNMKTLKNQTEQMLNIVYFQLMTLESSELKTKIEQIESQIRKIRAKRKSRSPHQLFSEYQCYGGHQRKQRRSGKLIAAQLRKSRSNMKTQCDSKAPSFPSPPGTPTPRCKAFLSPQKQYIQDYMAILRQKKEAIQNSIDTSKSFYAKRIEESSRQNNLLTKQIALLQSKNSNYTPIRSNKFRSTVGGGANSSSRSQTRGNRRLLAVQSPPTPRNSSKNKMLRLIANARQTLMSNPRQEYFLSN